MAEKKKAKASLGEIEPKLREKKQLPGVGDLLAYGSEESWGKEKTWWDILSVPLILLVLFILSFHLLLYAFPEITQQRGRSFPRSHFIQTPAPDKEPPLKPVEVKVEPEEVYEF